MKKSTFLFLLAFLFFAHQSIAQGICAGNPGIGVESAKTTRVQVVLGSDLTLHAPAKVLGRRAINGTLKALPRVRFPSLQGPPALPLPSPIFR
ncbi:hypothetical protein KFE98_07425 [bacterium SCSIO 12741]|nr:hypothetical protein KFE98_07425 [bacterium SCSIO 12741]